jgi:hypothetical protein
MTPFERRLLAQRLCDEIMSRPLGFPLDAAGGILTPAIPAKIFHLSSRRRPSQRSRPLDAAGGQVLPFTRKPRP